MLAKLGDLEARFTDVFWQELAPELALSRRVRGGPDAGAADELTDLAERIAALEAVLSRWSRLERTWKRPAPRAPRGRGSRTGGADPTAETVLAREQLELLLRGMRPRFPIDVRVRPNGALRVHWAVATSAPRGAGAVAIEPERLLDDLRKMAGVLTDIEVGDDRFDGIFLVRGHEPTVRRVLDAETRRSLLRLGARSAGVRAELAGGEACVQLHA
ncbi:MAG: hypothetical protein M3Y87_05395, partial [Myxococcota bacterium]|nr:hypothetical protein [Myxococcota bacterium]